MSTADPRALCPGCFVTPLSAEICGYCGFNPREPRPPSAIGLYSLVGQRFLVGGILGKPGGFGITYLAYDHHRGEPVALKEYLPRDLAVRAADSATVLPQSHEEGELFRYGLGQFINEAELVSQLQHPNVVRVRELVQANGTAYLAMDYYRGRSLAEFLALQPEGRIDERVALGLLQPVLDGLRTVHARGFLHRDVKPANIYLAKIGGGGGVNPILLDFGAARTAVGERSRSLSVLVTDGYAPFEQYHRRGRQGPATDIYAVGGVLYRMLTGSTPPPAPERINHDTLQPAAQQGVSQPVSDAIDHALRLDAEQRPQSVQDFQQALAGAAAPQPTEPSEPPPLRWSDEAPADDDSVDATQPGPAPRSRSDAFLPRLVRGELGLPRTFWLFGLAVFAVFGLILFAIQQSPAAMGGLNLLFTAYAIPICIGIWRAGSRFTGATGWGVSAKLVVLLLAAVNLWSWGTILMLLNTP